jgi:hypothetical protein
MYDEVDNASHTDVSQYTTSRTNKSKQSKRSTHTKGTPERESEAYKSIEDKEAQD